MIITDIYDGKMANCCQNVRGNKTNKDQNDNKKQTNGITKRKNKTKQKQQNGRRGRGLKKQITNRMMSSDDVIIIDLRERERIKTCTFSLVS